MRAPDYDYHRVVCNILDEAADYIADLGFESAVSDQERDLHLAAATDVAMRIRRMAERYWRRYLAK
jgi:hypothetical protein